MANTARKPPRQDWPNWVAVMLTACAGLVGITVQWGVVTTKLSNLEKRLDEMIFESRSLRQEYQLMERRVSALEGRQRASQEAP